MKDGLEPCPFCKDEYPIRLVDGGKPTGIVAHACYEIGREIRMTEHAWNTRMPDAKDIIAHIDRINDTQRVRHLACGECGHTFGYEIYDDFTGPVSTVRIPNFCDNCGTKTGRITVMNR